MRELELPYPLVVGQLHAGEWSSMVPDQLVFEGRLGVPVGVAPETAREELQRVVDAALDDDLPRCVLTWEGGAFASGTTDPEHPWVKTVQGALAAEIGSAAARRRPWGADLRLLTARGIPTVMVGTRGIELAHAVDENVSTDELAHGGPDDRSGPDRAVLDQEGGGEGVLAAGVLRRLLGRVQLALDEVQALVPEARVGEVDADDRPSSSGDLEPPARSRFT